jgi:hypothetical protein
VAAENKSRAQRNRAAGALRNDSERVGLCADCAHCRRIESSRGAVFYLCGLSATDPAFPKYPPLPVTRCSGYSAKK